MFMSTNSSNKDLITYNVGEYVHFKNVNDFGIKNTSLQQNWQVKQHCSKQMSGKLFRLAKQRRRDIILIYMYLNTKLKHLLHEHNV